MYLCTIRHTHTYTQVHWQTWPPHVNKPCEIYMQSERMSGKIMNAIRASLRFRRGWRTRKPWHKQAPAAQPHHINTACDLAAQSRAHSPCCQGNMPSAISQCVTQQTTGCWLYSRRIRITRFSISAVDDWRHLTDKLPKDGCVNSTSL